MEQRDASEFLAECFWPGVAAPDLRALDERATAAAAEVSREGAPVTYLGYLLMREDEVVLCRFEGSADAVRTVAERAAIPFERIVATAASPWAREPHA